MAMTRTISTYISMDPQVMYDTGSKAALFYALEDARKDLLVLAALLDRIAYPRRGTPDESASLQDFADEIQVLFPLGE